MKISSQEEFGLRILIRIAQHEKGLSINEISELEGITKPNVAKICRVLRMENLLSSIKGHTGGYQLANNPKDISLKVVLSALDKPIYHSNFCEKFSGEVSLCTNSVDCSVRSLWAILQSQLDMVLEKLTLADLLGNEKETQESICKTSGLDSIF